MANKSTNSPSRLELIQNGVKKLYSVNKNYAVILIVLSIFSAIGNFSNSIGDSPSDNSGTTAGANLNSAEITAIVVGVTLLVIAFMIAGVFIQGMMSYATWKAINNKTTSLSEAFEATQDKFWTIVWLNIIIFFRVLGGFLLLIVPGIRASLRYTIATIVVFDQNLSAKNTANKSREIAVGNLNSLLIANIVSSVLFPVTQLVMQGSLVAMYPYFKSRISSSTKPATK